MFVYLIIAIELAVLYVVFWIVFLREPRPKEVRAELWGSYFKPANKSAQRTAPSKPSEPIINEEQLDFYLPSILPSPQLYRTVKMKKIRRKKIRRSPRSPLYCQWCSHSHSYAHGQTSLTQQASRPVVEKFLLSLNRVLNKLSVKVP